MKKQIVRMSMLVLLTIVAGTGCQQASQESAEQEKNEQTAAVVAEPAAPAVNPEVYEAYTGKYKMKNAEFEFLTVSREADKLYAQASGLEKVEMIPMGTDSFDVAPFKAHVFFNRNAQNQVPSLMVKLHFEGKELPGERVQ